MTTTTPSPAAAPAAPPVVTFVLDDVEVSVPKGTLVIRAAEQIGIQIPRFCDHPLLAPAGACRQCLVEVAVPDREGVVRPMPKPQASCTLEATPGMVVRTQRTSPVADRAQHGVMELLLINHPLDCPTCDKGGECPLQNQAMSNGRGTSRFVDVKRTYPKPLAISTQILLDRERCILCQRCTRFSDEIAGDPFIDLQMRGVRQQIGTFDPTVLGFEGAGPLEVYRGAPAERPAVPQVGTDGAGPVGAAELDTSGRPFASYFSGNTIQICPVGALTGAAYRFRSRPFDLVSTPGIAEHDSSGAAIRVDHRRGVVLRRLAGDDPAVNEEWLTDKDRFAFAWQAAADRLTVPMVRDTAEDGTRGELRPASWSEALDVAAAGLAAADGVGVLPGGRVTLEDAWAYSKFARVVLGTNDIDHRARPHSSEEADFLAHHVAGAPLDVTFADLESAPATLLVAFEPEDEGGVVFLRLRKGVVAGRTRVLALAPFAGRALDRLDATLLPTAPGTEPEVLDALVVGADGALGEAAAALAGGVVLVGERLATVPGGLSAVLRLARRVGARVAWVPRRAGERGAVEAGTLPGLLPGGRPVADPVARVDMAAVWGVERLPAEVGRDTRGILAAAGDGTLGALVVGGVDPADLPDPAGALRALEQVGFLVSLEVRASAVTALADVVLPVAPPVEKPGTFLSWERRPRPFPQALTSSALADHRVLDALADAMDARLGLRTLAQVHAEIDHAGAWDGARPAAPDVAHREPAALGAGQAVLATWHLLLDSGRCQDGEAFLAGTAPRPVARLGARLAGELGIATGDPLSVTTEAGVVTLPAVVTPMVDAVVWLPVCSPGSTVRATLQVDAGAVVQVTAGARTPVDGEAN
ncbi:MAG TPA: NADH-quinone oxidoreductase subunit G [Actinotalea sp.]|nr:NADH-quinone oxidoreductase subunit G [Actinotalea sp.]